MDSINELVSTAIFTDSDYEVVEKYFTKVLTKSKSNDLWELLPAMIESRDASLMHSISIMEVDNIDKKLQMISLWMSKLCENTDQQILNDNDMFSSVMVEVMTAINIDLVWAYSQKRIDQPVRADLMYFYILVNSWLNKNKLKFVEMVEMAANNKSGGGIPVIVYIIIVAGIYYTWTLFD